MWGLLGLVGAIALIVGVPKAVGYLAGKTERTPDTHIHLQAAPPSAKAMDGPASTPDANDATGDVSEPRSVLTYEEAAQLVATGRGEAIYDPSLAAALAERGLGTIALGGKPKVNALRVDAKIVYWWEGKSDPALGMFRRAK